MYKRPLSTEWLDDKIFDEMKNYASARTFLEKLCFPKEKHSPNDDASSFL